MISAKEAKDLYDHSNAEVTAYLQTKVEKEIVNAAKAGRLNTIIHLGTLDYLEHVDQKITPHQMAVISKLKELGYTAEIKRHGASYVPRGLASDDGTGPAHQNYGIHIGW
jgi:diphthamide biosynthesis methyltransferase